MLVIWFLDNICYDFVLPVINFSFFVLFSYKKFSWFLSLPSAVS